MDLTNSTPEAGGAATPETAPDTTTGTVPPDSQANGEGAPIGEESFTSLDPRTLPPQLKASYDNMLKDYKAKTSSLSERIKAESAKAAEAYRQEAEQYRTIAGQEKFVEMWNKYVQESQSQGQPTDGDPKLTQLEQKFEEINQKLQAAETNQIMEAFADAVNEKGQKLHADFDELNSTSIVKTPDGKDFSLLNLCVKLAPGANPQEKLANGYKFAKQAYSGIFEAGRKAGMGRLQAKIQNGTQPPTNSTGDGLSFTDKKPKSAREALEMARKGQLVSRD